MKKTTAMVLILIFCLIVCSQTTAFAAAPQSGETVQIANPWHSITEAEAEKLCPKSFRVPDGAQNVQWSVMESAADPSGVPGALVQLSFELNGLSFTAREQLTGDEEIDQSGMYYDWTAQLEVPLKHLPEGTICHYYRCIGENEYADLCIWYDAEEGISCSLSVTAQDLDGFDLIAIVEAIYEEAEDREEDSASQNNVFVYIHDPRENPEAMADILENADAVYGFSPDPQSRRLGAYAEYDWTDPVFVARAKEERKAYHESMDSMTDILYQMREEGASTEEMARAISAERNRLRLVSYEDDPDGLARVKESNLKTYGHEDGPTADELYEQYGSWTMVIQKAFSANMGMDACCGLYDEYYQLYIELGYVEP